MAHWKFPKRRKMKITDSIGYLIIVGICLISIDLTHQLTNGNKYPSYSLQNMPKTAFSCRGKILGGYYADADTQCQMFHICVKIAGVGVQDFRFLCPNGTAFDQEAQTCADFGDVDCDQATLFYGSDNFDLYRIGSGFDSSKRPTPATEDESTFHLQRAESNDIRRSKQPIAVQNSLYNLGSSLNQQQFDLSSVKPANQYQKATSTTPRNVLANRKSTTTVAPNLTVKPATLVLVSSSNNNNDEIFKGSHSSNFYSNRNNHDDEDDYKRTSLQSGVKGRLRSRGRTQYRGTPATTTTTTTIKPSQNLTTPAFTKSTTPSPFKFTFSSTARANPSYSNVASQTTLTPLGPLQQQYQQPNYNNNFVNYKIPSTTAAPTTQRSNFRGNSFNHVTTPATFAIPQRQIVSSPTPFNTNFINANVNKPVSAAFTSNNNFQNTSKSIRTFDNHNVINNYQTTSPFYNPRIIENHIANNTNQVRLTPTIANHFNPANAPRVNNTFYQPVTTVHPTTTLPSQIRLTSSQDRPNFNQQDLINQFNADQRKTSQPKTPAPVATVQNRQSDAQAYLSLEQKRLQLHYDINDYLTTDKFTTRSQYSPTSEQYKSVQSFTNSIPQTTPPNQFTQKYADAYTTTPKVIKQFEAKNQYQTQQDRPANQFPNQQFNFNAQSNVRGAPTVPPTPSPIQNINNNVVPTSTKKFSTLVPKESYAPTTFKPQFYFNVAKQINDHLSTPIKPKTATDSLLLPSTSTTSRTIDPIFNRNPSFPQTNFKEPKPQPAFQLPQKSAFQSQQQVFQPQQTAFQPSKEPSIQSSNKPVSQPPKQPIFQPSQSVNLSAIDENDGQYHPELYERDFARYKIKNRKKQQQIIQQSSKQNLAKQNVAKNDFSNKQNNQGTQRFAASHEEEFLNTAHSQNIAASGNELWANSKNTIKAKQTYNQSKAPTIPPNAAKKEKPAVPKEDKDVSYDYAYYDSGNDTPHEYSEFDLSDFGKTPQ